MHRLWLSLGVLAVAGCVVPGPPSPPDSPSSGATSSSSTSTEPFPPDEAVVDGRLVHFQPSLWRDFMPGVNSNGSAMMLVIRLRWEGPEPWTTNLTAAGTTIDQGNQTWRPALEWLPRQTAANITEWVGREGPRWEPYSFADVEATFHVERGDVFRFRAHDVQVEMTV